MIVKGYCLFDGESMLLFDLEFQQKMSGKDTQWIDAAYSVMSGANRPMHINEIEQEIVNRKLATNL